MSGGPKNYGYVTVKGKSVIKVKGIGLNYKTNLIINLNSMKGMVDNRDTVLSVADNNITRNKPSLEVKSSEKKYRFVYDKRVITENYETIPYGY